MGNKEIITFVGDNNGKTVEELLKIRNKTANVPTDHKNLLEELHIDEVTVDLLGRVRLTPLGVFRYCKDSIRMDRMGAGNSRDRQTLYGDVLDWLRDMGFGKNHVAALLLIGDYAVDNNWDGRTK